MLSRRQPRASPVHRLGPNDIILSLGTIVFLPCLVCAFTFVAKINIANTNVPGTVASTALAQPGRRLRTGPQPQQNPLVPI
ncbi:hypothetical protein V496_01750 [Pseudogymnoascus sp. VKM F-4515 (FW-2607)]|nr:hypothetical protein V496_01750 [Pseudogymnoascus sp. VKM F-4515 (FW-2607)]